jgi:hypothetical protein
MGRPRLYLWRDRRAQHLSRMAGGHLGPPSHRRLLLLVLHQGRDGLGQNSRVGGGGSLVVVAARRGARARLLPQVPAQISAQQQHPDGTGRTR